MTFNFKEIEADVMIDEILTLPENTLVNEYFHIKIEKGVIYQSKDGMKVSKTVLYDNVDCDSKDIAKLIKKLKE